MRNIVVSVRNGLLSEAIIRALNNCGEFQTYPVSPETRTSIPDQCKAICADLLLMEVSYAPGTTVEARMDDISRIRAADPGCRIALLCDDRSAPEIAYKITQLKKDRLIDGFFYTSVSESYLLSALASL